MPTKDFVPITPPDSCLIDPAPEDKTDRRSLPEKILDNAVLRCLGCIVLRQPNVEGMKIPTRELVLCSGGSGRVIVGKSLARIAAMQPPLIELSENGKAYVFTKIGTDHTIDKPPKNCQKIHATRKGRRTATPASQPVQHQAEYEAPLPQQPVAHQAKQPSKRQLLQEKIIEQVRTCISCISHRHPNENHRVHTTEVAACTGIQLKRVEQTLYALSTESDAPIEPRSSQKRQYPFTTAAQNLPAVNSADCKSPNRAKEETRPAVPALTEPQVATSPLYEQLPAESTESSEHTLPKAVKPSEETAQAVIDGVVGCIRCAKEACGSDEFTIYLKDIAACRDLSTRQIRQLLPHDESLLTPMSHGSYMPTAAAIALGKDSIRAMRETAMTCDERFMQWACEVPRFAVQNIKANLTYALAHTLIEYRERPRGVTKGFSAPMHTPTRRYFAVGPALKDANKHAQQAVMYVLGLDELVYGKRLSQMRLKEELGLKANADLGNYVRFALHRLATQQAKRQKH